MTKCNYDFVQKNFANVKAGYEADGPDCTVPGACRGPARYALVTESLRGHGYFVNWCEDLQGVERAAASNIDEGWQPVCYFDLFELAGSAEIEYCVECGNEIKPDPDGSENVWVHDTDSLAWDLDEDHTAQPENDQRMPARYMVAKIITQVVFNTIPQPA